MANTKGLTTKGVPPAPHWLLYLKFAILGLSFVVFAISCYAASVGWWAVGGAGFLIFVTIKTFIIYGAFLFIELKAPHLFFRIVALILYIFSIIFWLSAWAWAAEIAGVWLSYLCYGSYCTNYGPYKGFGAALAAAAALGAVVWVLSIVHLVFFIKACLHDPEGSATNPHHQAELGQVKAQEAAAPATYPQQTYAEPQHQQQYAQQPQGYPQQTYAEPHQQQPQHQQQYTQ